MRKITYFVVAAIIVTVAILVLLSEPKSEKSIVYHITLADPKLYNDNGIFTDFFEIQKGTYQFSFVPNGDSPQTLSIALKGATFSFAEDFQLEGIAHDTGISTYYTWDYLGTNEILVSEDQQLQIVINSNGNLLGSVSVDLIKT